jgi:hypothetical protein
MTPLKFGAPGTRNTDNYEVGGREDKDGIGTFRERNISKKTYNNAYGQGANR